jgi:hypothetical protein
MHQRNLILGLLLIGAGLYFAYVQATGSGGEAIVALIGAGFLVAYAVTRAYGFLVPGAIMTGLGLGVLWETQVGDAGGVVVIGLGLGFIAIYVIDAIVRRSQALWWPLIPGGILTIVGVATESENQGLLEDLGWLWPIALIAVGGLLVLLQVRERRQPQEPGPGGADTSQP